MCELRNAMSFHDTRIFFPLSVFPYPEHQQQTTHHTLFNVMVNATAEDRNAISVSVHQPVRTISLD